MSSVNLQRWCLNKGKSSGKPKISSVLKFRSEMVQRIDANTEDVVENVEGAQRELMKYWSRVSGNRWLVAKMFGVLMVPIVSFSLTGTILTRSRFSSFFGCWLLDKTPFDDLCMH